VDLPPFLYPGDDHVTVGKSRIRIVGWVGSVSIVWLAALAAPAHGFYSLRTPEDLQLLTRSELAEADGDRAAAIAWAESLATLEPHSSFVLGRIATLHEELGEDETARSWGERALAADSMNADAAMLVGRMALRSGQSGVAVQVLTPPLRQLGAMPELYALRALAHELERNYEPSLADLKRTGVLLPDFAWIATGILGLALEDGRLEEAYSALQLALELQPDDPRTLHLGVDLARRMENPILEEALLRQLALGSGSRLDDMADYGAHLVHAGKTRDFDQLLAWASTRGVAPSGLRVETGRALLRLGGYQEAIEVVKPLKRDPRALPIRTRAWLYMGDERRALEGYRILLPSWTLSREESLVVAYLEIKIGNREAGVRVLDQVRRAPLDSSRQVMAASLCYSLLGRPGETVELIREGTARGLSSPTLYEQLGTAATAVGDSLLAQWAWERLRDTGKETSECLYFLASADLSHGDGTKAVGYLNRAIQLNPRNGKALLLLGRIQSRRGQLESARETLILASQCPEAAAAANRELAQVCRRLRLDAEAREAEAKAKDTKPQTTPGLSFFETR
jgi:tetratricopeptide (TPR) repeat protein